MTARRATEQQSQDPQGHADTPPVDEVETTVDGDDVGPQRVDVTVPRPDPDVPTETDKVRAEKIRARVTREQQ